jgi:hypothetical protein
MKYGETSSRRLIEVDNDEKLMTEMKEGTKLFFLLNMFMSY